ncbi:hypothetical protein AVEN_270896-1 [Araneus ventricosus]|uniref:Transposon Ty3-I Gag-Pol polyprotein n=1 Tax=Araneus ventricosus TaxID=182803 RepID=A0A4Y2T5M1_ARAVE|nr:hypothetical protein AVEN_270896-1 [Araneus ventricosus]
MGHLNDIYNKVFEGLGNLPGKYHISVCENSVPVVSVTRKVAFSLLEPLKAELDRMVKAGVIEKVTEPTVWVSPLVIVQKKNGALRVCLDPQNLTRAIKRPQYNLPTFEDITSKLAGAKYFSVLDAVPVFCKFRLTRRVRVCVHFRLRSEDLNSCVCHMVLSVRQKDFREQ